MIIQPPSPGQRRTPDRQQVQAAAASAGLVLSDVAMLALQQGRMIEAIKLIRTANPGLDLTRAKALMERVQVQTRSATADTGAGSTGGSKTSMPLQAHRPTVVMGDPPGQLRWLLVVVGLLAAAVWIGFHGTN